MFIDSQRISWALSTAQGVTGNEAIAGLCGTQGVEKEGSTDPTDKTPAWEPPSHEWEQDARVV